MFHCQLWWGPQVFPVICHKLISTRHTVTVVWSNRYLKIQNQICLAFFRNLYDYFVAVMIRFFCFKAYPSHSHITVKIKRLETFLVVLIDLIWPWFQTTVSNMFNLVSIYRPLGDTKRQNHIYHLRYSIEFLILIF